MRKASVGVAIATAYVALVFSCMLPNVATAKEAPAEVRERQAKVREKVEASNQAARDRKAAQGKVAPCPLPGELRGQTADGWCASKGYIDVFNQPAVGLKCGAPAREAKDDAWRFLSNYEMRGCNKAEGCAVYLCDALYKTSRFARPAE